MMNLYKFRLQSICFGVYADDVHVFMTDTVNNELMSVEERS